MTPTVEFPPGMLSTDQTMEGLLRSGKLAVNCCVAPAIKVAEVGETELVLATVIEALALFVVSATLIAVIVCEPAAAGAWYTPVNCAVVPAGTFVDGSSIVTLMLGGGGDLGGGAGEETLWHPSNTKATANTEQTRKQQDEQIS
jgi:hypothetical protein